MRSHKNRLPWRAPWTNLFCIVCLFPLGCLWVVESTVIRDDADVAAAQLNLVSIAIDKATQFFGRDYSDVNVDGLFGVRLASGAIIGALTDCNKPDYHCPDTLTSWLHEAIDKLQQIGGSALPYVEARDPEYYNKFVETIDSPYTVTSIPDHLGYSEPEPILLTSYGEMKGDECLASLLGTFIKDGQTAPRCTITDDCWLMMTQGSTGEYFRTHQLLYFILGDKAGCLEPMEKRLRTTNGSSVREFQKKQCRNILMEAAKEEKDGHVSSMDQDLFLEQSVLCGILGFDDFFRTSWISMVLQWQTSEGCFTMSGPLANIVSGITAAEREHRRLLKMLEEEARKIDEAAPVKRGTGRRLLREQVMEGDCLAHKSGLAIGTLGTYLRYLVGRVYGPA